MMFKKQAQSGEGRAERRLAGGLSLPGLIGLMSFLVILLVVLVGSGSWVRQSGRQRITRRTLVALDRALVAYNQAAGEFPQRIQSNAQLLERLNGTKASRDILVDLPEHVYKDTARGREILDGWGRPLRYALGGSAAKRGRVFSDGPDQQDRADDIYAQDMGPGLFGDLDQRQRR